MQEIVLASGNTGKLRELQQTLGESNVLLIPQSELGVTEAEETGLSFVENAIIKARHACPRCAQRSSWPVHALRHP